MKRLSAIIKKDFDVLHGIGLDIDISGEKIEYYLEEVLGDERLCLHFENLVSLYPDIFHGSWQEFAVKRPDQLTLYCYIREAKVEAIVETGTSTGDNSALLANALYKNGRGLIALLDLPATDLVTETSLASADLTGCCIPPHLRRHTYMVQGDTKVTLTSALAEIKPLLFIHDSLHTITHMMFEYSAARCLMEPGSLICSDDILWNKGFEWFVNIHGLPAARLHSNPNFGVAINHVTSQEAEFHKPSITTSISTYFRLAQCK